MKRIFLLLLALVLLGPAALGEETPPYDWRADWEAWGSDQYAEVQDDTLIIFDGAEPGQPFHLGSYLERICEN